MPVAFRLLPSAFHSLRTEREPVSVAANCTSANVAFTISDIGLRWLYYLAVFASLAVAVNGPGSLALERLLPVPRWLRE